MDCIFLMLYAWSCQVKLKKSLTRLFDLKGTAKHNRPKNKIPAENLPSKRNVTRFGIFNIYLQELWNRVLRRMQTFHWKMAKWYLWRQLQKHFHNKSTNLWSTNFDNILSFALSAAELLENGRGIFEVDYEGFYHLTLSWRRPLSYRNQCIDLRSIW